MAFTFIRCCHVIIALLIFVNAFYLKKKTFYRVLFSIWNFRIKILFLIPIYSCYMICLTRCSMFEMRYAREVAYWGCGMLGMWDGGDVECSACRMFGMWDVRDMGCWGCGMSGMWDVWDPGCWGCGMLGMWDVGDVWCPGCGMFGMWDIRDVRDVECSRCGLFGMWDVWDVGCGMLIYKMPSVIGSFSGLSNKSLKLY